jgi:hypothetical protein
MPDGEGEPGDGEGGGGLGVQIWEGDVREEGGVAVLEDCLWARRVVSWESEEGKGKGDIRLWGY